MLDEFARVDEFARTTAAHFVALFEQYVLADAVQLDPSAATQMIGALRETGVDVVANALRRAIDAGAEEAVARYADAE